MTKHAPAIEIPGRTLADFVNENDRNIVVPRKIEAALARIGTQWRKAVEFQKESGVSLIELNAFRDQYLDYIVVVRKDGKPSDIWFGDKDAAAEARKSVR